MEKIVARLVVFFEEPFWVGIYEREHENRYAVCKITFGAEPNIVVINHVLSFATLRKQLFWVAFFFYKLIPCEYNNGLRKCEMPYDG